ncbi:MAG: hypothetical protein ABMA14_19885 [Hyphomonadaceae bacterium]
MKKEDLSAQARQDKFATVDAKMRDWGVDVTDFGFYDSPAFLRQEQRDPTALEDYARWVAFRPRGEVYDTHVRQVVPKLVEIVGRALASDDMQGSCTMAGCMISRMLDRLGVWSVGIHGSLVVELPRQRIWRGLQDVDTLDRADGTTGHAWVFAPPFAIGDATLGLQPWGSPLDESMPKTLVVEAPGHVVIPQVTDVVGAEIVQQYLRHEGELDPNLHLRLAKRLKPVSEFAPAIEVTHGDIVLRYVPSAVRLSDVPLEEINTSGSKGRTGAAIWRDDVAPQFDVT